MEAITKGSATPAVMPGTIETSPAVPRLDDVLDKPFVPVFQPGRLVELGALGVLDLVGFALSFFLALVIRIYILPAVFSVFPAGFSPSRVTALWWLPGVFLLFFTYEGLYSKRQPFWRELYSLVKAITLTFMIALAVVSLAKIHDQVSRTVIVLAWLNSLVVIPLARYAGKNFLAGIGIWQRRVLILGAGKTGELVAGALDRQPYLGYRICGFLDDEPIMKAHGVQVNGVRYPVLGGFRDSDRVMQATGVGHLVVATPGMPARALVGLVNRLQRRAATVLVVPDLFGLPVVGAEADYFFDEQVLAFRVHNNLASPVNLLVKRAFDLAAGSLILVVTLPLMALIALAVKLDSPGPVFFKHRRIGMDGREFWCYKFRTMFLDNEVVLSNYLRANPLAYEEWEKYAKLRGHDPRLTRVGRFLRRFSLDELPQILNVLKAEMSLVGPRPYLQRERQRMGNSAENILLARPGITGFWQVSGRNEIDFEGRLQLESWYVRNWSLWLDITILIRTVGVVLGRRGAY